MKKIVFLATFINIFALQAQLSFEPHPTTINGNATDVELTEELDIRNSGATSITAKAYRTTLSAPTSSSNYMCIFDVCLLPTVDASPSATLAANAVNGSMSVHYKPQGNNGQAQVKYKVEEVNNTTNFCETTITYNTADVVGNPLSINNPTVIASQVIHNQDELILIIAQPTNEFSVTVYDISGTKITTISTQQNNMNRIPLANLASGMYFAVLQDDKGTIYKPVTFVK